MKPALFFLWFLCINPAGSSCNKENVPVKKAAREAASYQIAPATLFMAFQ